jgi:3-phenylpropionate/trans-cinnamate dioxygenase ferredoxin reductase subunit
MIQIAGHPVLARQTVARGTDNAIPPLVFGLDAQNRVVAVVGFNAGRDYRAARKLVEASAQVDPAALANPAIALASAAKAIQAGK